MTQFEARANAIADAVKAGASVEEASSVAGVPAATVRRWLRDGRKGKQPYAVLSTAVDGAKKERKQAEQALADGPLSPEEAERLVARAARKGSVPALRLYFERVAAADASERGASTRELLAEVFRDDR